jgi:hypothetical protein
MGTKLACSVVPTVEICPNCKSEMTNKGSHADLACRRF